MANPPCAWSLDCQSFNAGKRSLVFWHLEFRIRCSSPRGLYYLCYVFLVFVFSLFNVTDEIKSHPEHIAAAKHELKYSGLFCYIYVYIIHAAFDWVTKFFVEQNVWQDNFDSSCLYSGRIAAATCLLQKLIAVKLLFGIFLIFFLVNIMSDLVCWLGVFGFASAFRVTK